MLAGSEVTDIYTILIAVGEPAHLAVLLALSAPLARAQEGRVVPLYVGAGESAPPWLRIPERYQDVVEEPVVLSDTEVGEAVLGYARRLQPDLLLLHWRGRPARGRFLLGRTLDPLIEYAPCDVAVLRVIETPDAFVRRMDNVSRVLVPSGGGPNASRALALAMDLSSEATITALRVASPHMGPTAISAQWGILRSVLEPYEKESRVQPEVVLSTSVTDGILQETANDYDMVMIGATGESFVDRLVFGNLPQELAQRVSIPILIVRRCENVPAATWRRMRWRLINVMTQLTTEERIGAYRQLRRNARPDRDYYVMMTLSAGIASLGLLLNSAAVIIGAMLVAPMMTSLVGVGMGIVQGDSALLRLSLRTLLTGTAVVIVVSGLVGLAARGAPLTSEMMARTSPNLLDLAVALLAGAAAGYASAREDVASALPGVAVAVALVPPLATFGLTAAAVQSAAALGSFLLYITNLVGIVAAGAIMFLWMGFRPNIAEKPRAQTFRGGVLGTAVLGLLVAAVLGVLTFQGLREGAIRGQIDDVLEEHIAILGPRARVSEWRADIGQVVDVKIFVETEEEITTAQVAQMQRALADRVDRPVALDVTEIRVRRLAPEPRDESRAPPGVPWRLDAKDPMLVRMGSRVGPGAG